jgi:2-C-methyl-D-erythritol 4-phosphate cytidylyltransferase
MGGIKKEYRPLPGSEGGLTVLGAAVSAFAAAGGIGAIVIAVPADLEKGESAARAALPPDLLAGKNSPAVHFVPGGETRRASVFNALSLLGEQERPPGIVLIHDGARPWVSPSLIRRIINGAKQHHAVIPLVPVMETPKETEAPLGGTGPVFITRHLRRALVGIAQTPQGFAFSKILAAHRQAAAQENPGGFEFTDDAEIWAFFCGRVAAIPGEPENRKITFPGDLC